MAERNSWAVGSDTDRRIDVEDARLAMGALWTPDGTGLQTRPGFRPGPGSGGQVTASSPTADTAVHVAAFQYVLPASRGSGPYVATLDASETIDVLTDHPADAANPRRDLIIAQQSDRFYGDDSNLFQVRHLVGTASATPSDPAVDGSPDYVLLARIAVKAAAAAITSADITDLRPTPLLTVAVGGILPVGATGQRPDDPWPGMTIYRTDWGWHETWDGTAWRVVSQITVSSISALTTGVSDPFEGQVAYVRSVDALYVYDGFDWQPHVPAMPTAKLVCSNANQSFADQATVAVKFSTAPIDDLGGWNGTDGYIVQRTGRYSVSGNMTWGAYSGGYRQLYTTLNGQPIDGSQGSTNVIADPGVHVTPCSSPAQLVDAQAGDTIRMMAWQNSGGAISMTGNVSSGAQFRATLNINCVSKS